MGKQQNSILYSLFLIIYHLSFIIVFMVAIVISFVGDFDFCGDRNGSIERELGRLFAFYTIVKVKVAIRRSCASLGATHCAKWPKLRRTTHRCCGLPSFRAIEF